MKKKKAVIFNFNPPQFIYLFRGNTNLTAEITKMQLESEPKKRKQLL